MRAVGVQLETVPWKPVRRGEWRFYRDAALNLFSRYPFTVAKNYDPVLRARAEALARTLSGAARDNHVAAHHRLTHPDGMGQLFKVIAIHPTGTPPPPGLDPLGATRGPA